MKPFFSIVIPTLNEEKFLPKLLTDLTKQNEKDYEVIVADGFSKDNTKECARSYKSQLHLQFIQTLKKNVAAQRNYGAGKASGDYLIFLDADTRINPSFLKKVKAKIIKDKGLLFIPFLAPEKGDEEYRPLFDLGNLLVEFSHLLKRKFSLGGSFIIEKSFFHLIGGFDEKLFLAEDHELIQRASQWGVNSRFLHDVKIVFSLRRWKKEGNLNIIYKHIIATAYRLFGKEIKDKLFEYKMGGHGYLELKKRKNNEFFLLDYRKMLKKIKKIAASLINEI